MTGFDWGVVVALVLYGVTQIGGGIWLMASLKAKSEGIDNKVDGLDKKLANIEALVAAMQARSDVQLGALRSEFHGDLNGIRSQVTQLAVEVGKVIGRQDARS